MGTAVAGELHCLVIPQRLVVSQKYECVTFQPSHTFPGVGTVGFIGPCVVISITGVVVACVDASCVDWLLTICTKI